MSRQCITCGVEIDPRRIKILPHTQTCTQHSTAEKKVAVTVQMGEGDHTWIETYAVDREVYDKIQEAEKNFRKQSNPKPKKKKIKEEEDEFAFAEDDSNILIEDEDDLKEWDDILEDGLEDDDWGYDSWEKDEDEE